MPQSNQLEPRNFISQHGRALKKLLLRIPPSTPVSRSTTPHDPRILLAGLTTSRNRAWNGRSLQPSWLFHLICSVHNNFSGSLCIHINNMYSSDRGTNRIRPLEFQVSELAFSAATRPFYQATTPSPPCRCWSSTAAAPLPL